jgi:hypothetical protein
LLGFIWTLPPARTFASLGTVVQQAPQTQPAQAAFPPFYLSPDATTSVQLQTHTAEFQIFDVGDEPLSVSYQGLYRFKNEGKELVELPLVFLYEGADETMPAITLSADGALITPDLIEGGYQSEVRIAPGASLDLRLSYSAPLGDAPLALLRYDVRDLLGWPGNSSLRTTIVMPESIEAESWIDVAPDGWNYVTTSDADTVGIHWLYDGAFPQGAFLFQFVTPDTWRQISALSAVNETDPVATIELGNLYRQIYQTLPVDLFAETRDRFYAQALAAYTSGIETATTNGEPEAVTAGLHAGLASLYRGRILEADGDPDPGYLALMVQMTSDALAGLPEGDVRRTELQQWQADGLRQLLADAQRTGDWLIVLALLDQMEALPQPPLSAEALTEARRAATVLQALDLLASGRRDAAIALAGDQILDATLRPGPELQSLFSGWQVTTTITTAGIDLHFVAHPAPGQLEPAREALGEQVNRWKELPVRSKASVKMSEIAAASGNTISGDTTSDSTTSDSTLSDNTVSDNIALRLDISAPDREAVLTLAQSTFPAPDWALLRTLLEQIAPLNQTNDQWLRRGLTMEQTLDLRGAGVQWTSMAENLENEAVVIEAAGRGVNPNDAAAVEAALRARIQASNYRIASQEWRNLASNSWVTTELKASAGDSVGRAGNEADRSWLATVDTPVQTYSLRAETLNPVRVSILALVLLGFLLLFSGLLWRLL